ncbi:MAG: EscU/YscU/HrcU family type III secretion system export apparatus switch protein [Cycloclasticus sp.]|nr:EscU/YscU/HrcU family type III secretion system export apparatus switch protein [Cycloclasticus sp.]
MKNTVNPPNIAVALKYDGKNTPTVTAKGKGGLAEEIINLAKENNIPLDSNPELVKVLSSIPLGDEIPDVLYLAVAEVIAFAYFLSDKAPEGYEKD